MTQMFLESTSGASSRVLARAQRWIAGPSAPRGLALLAVLICLPALALGLTTDDRSLFVHVRQGGVAPLELFTFASSEADIVQAMQLGELPWWASTDSRIRFLRPLSSLWHWLELTCWPHATWLMALENIALYAAAVWTAARLYRRLLPDSFAAGLAGLLFAIDEAHASAAGARVRNARRKRLSTA